ncbi:DEAD/DEAH box helicase family protein [bacterium]|nr:DEAD/DEAH box helicase family protein [bacterium]
MKHKPYNYQQQMFNDIMSSLDNGDHSIICQMATRSGKSIIALLLIEYFSIKMKESVYFVGHTKILLDQMSSELQENEIKHGIIAPWSPQLKYRVQVISKDTLFNRYKKMKETGWHNPRIIIVDECHISMSARYKEILDSYPGSIIIGLTATPVRLDGKGLNSIYKTMIHGPSIQELQELKRLCPIDTFAVEFDDSGLRTNHGDYNSSDVIERVDKPNILKDVVKHWELLAKNKKTLTFCASIKHAQDMAEEFNNAGYPSVAISSKDGKQMIDKKIAAYYAGEYINLCSVNLFIMGFTVKDCECVIQARPTQSLMIYLQTLGRGMMFILGKMLINIDAVNNYTRHGLPDDDRIWSLTGKLKTDKGRINHKRCPNCLRPVPIATRVCPFCGFQWTETAEAVSRIPEEKAGTLVNVRDRRQKQDLVLAIGRGAHNLKEAIKIGAEMGIKHTECYQVWTHTLKNKKDDIVAF